MAASGKRRLRRGSTLCARTTTTASTSVWSRNSDLWRYGAYTTPPGPVRHHSRVLCATTTRWSSASPSAIRTTVASVPPSASVSRCLSSYCFVATGSTIRIFFIVTSACYGAVGELLLCGLAVEDAAQGGARSGRRRNGLLECQVPGVDDFFDNDGREVDANPGVSGHAWSDPAALVQGHPPPHLFAVSMTGVPAVSRRILHRQRISHLDLGQQWLVDEVIDAAGGYRPVSQFAILFDRIQEPAKLFENAAAEQSAVDETPVSFGLGRKLKLREEIVEQGNTLVDVVDAAVHLDQVVGTDRDIDR